MKFKIAALIMLILLFLPFASAYKVVDYETFSYNSLGIDLLNHYFTSDAGIYYCGVTGEYMEMSTTISRSASKKFNLVPPNYCISGSHAAFGGARNFSLIMDVNFDQTTSSPTDFLTVFSTERNGTVYMQLDYYPNSSTGFIQTDGGASDIKLLNVPAPLTGWHNIQIDYFTTTLGVQSQIYAANFSVEVSEGVWNSTYIPAVTPQILGCINTTLFLSRVSNLINKFYIDNLIVVEYSSSEYFIPPEQEITDYYTFSNNEMPRIEVFTTDTDSVPDSSFSRKELFYIWYSSFYDNDGDIIYDAAVCDITVNNIQKLDIYDNFTDTLSVLQDRYNPYEKCNYTVYTSSEGKGLLFSNSSLNCSANKIISHFDLNYPASSRELDNSDYIIEFTAGLAKDHIYNIKFFDVNLNVPAYIGILYNSTENLTYFYTGSEEIPLLTAISNKINANELYDIRIGIDGENNLYTYALESLSSESIQFYSEPVSFSSNIPLESMQVFPSLFGSSSTTAENEFFGNYRLRSLKFPDIFYEGNISVPFACSQNSSGSYTGLIFATDSLHSDNYLDFEEFSYTVSLTGLDSDTGYLADDEDFSAIFESIFGESTVLKYLFALIVLSGLTVICFMIGAKYGSAVAGAAISIVIDICATVLMVLMGVLPIWFLIIILFAAAVGVAVLFSRMAGSGGE